LVEGRLDVTGIKSAIVPHADGWHRRLFCMEAPEPRFEDFGEDRFANGRGYVRLDPEFRAVVHAEGYDVYLTEYDDSHGLYVTNRTPAGFEVRTKEGRASGTFAYRVVAKRRDVVATRLEKVRLPERPPDRRFVRPLQ
jgi:hypothetical protein